MGESAKEGALEHLTIALGDADVDVRCEALKSLGKIKGDRCADLAFAALTDKEWKVRYAAVISLGEIGHNKAWRRSLTSCSARMMKRSGPGLPGAWERSETKGQSSRCSGV